MYGIFTPRMIYRGFDSFHGWKMEFRKIKNKFAPQSTFSDQ